MQPPKQTLKFMQEKAQAKQRTDEASLGINVVSRSQTVYARLASTRWSKSSSCAEYILCKF